ncbi:MAG: SDR family NAD(P)-dependent oxidoreductase [Dehalococcoidia bacterium]
MTVSLAGNVAIVSGGGRGLGRAYALDLAAHGAKVVVNDNGCDLSGNGTDHGPADSVAAEIKAAGGEAVASYDDVGTDEGAYAMVKLAVDTWGRVDALVCNAGMLRDAALHNLNADAWDAVLQTHLKGCYALMHHAWPVFRQQSYGRVVLATSSAGLYGNFGQSNYGSAKAGMVGLMNVSKLEGAKYNVMVSLIAPIAATRMTMNLMPPDRQQATRPELVAPAVTYLCSPQCTESGMIIEAGGGTFNRCSFVKSTGVKVDTTATPDASWVEANWSKITDLNGAVPMWDLGKTREQHAAEAAAGGDQPKRNTI